MNLQSLTKLHFLHYQASGGIFDDFTDDRLQFTSQVGGNNINPTSNYNPQQHQQLQNVATATIVSSTNPQQQQHQQQQQQGKLVHNMTNQGGYYPTAIHANYAITPAPQNGQNSAALGGGVMKGRPQTLVVQRHVGQQKLFSVGGPSN